MRVRVVTPSEAFASSAGMRIRYDRLKLGATVLGAEISASPIGELTSKSQLTDDIYIFSKTYTADAYLLAHRLSQMGKLVGVDIFDDYFSQEWDSRLLRFRTWLESIHCLLDFYICSTPRIRQAIQSFIGGTPSVIISDPSDTFDPRLLEFYLQQKIEEAVCTRHLKVLWFGIGDNPYFSVGIRDLVAFGQELAGFTARGWSAELKIITNKRALSVQNLNQLRRLPLPFTLEEWTPELETSEIAANHICFLPVNGQSFSRAKSLNRAISALSYGCQILSCGYPLYDPLSALVYTSADQLISDLEESKLRVRPETVPLVAQHFSELANPYRSAESLVAFLGELKKPAAGARVHQPPLGSKDAPSRFVVTTLLSSGFSPDLAVIHGAFPDQAVHKLSQKLGGLTIKGPLCNANWNFHARFDVTEDSSIRILVAEAILELVSPKIRKLLVPFGRILIHTFFELPQEYADKELNVKRFSLRGDHSFIRDLSAATRIMPETVSICHQLFPGTRIFISEKNALLARTWERAA